MPPSLVMDYRVGEIRPLVDQSSRTRLVMQVIRSGAARITELDYIGGSNLLFCMPLRSARGTMGALCIRLRPGIELAEDELGLASGIYRYGVARDRKRPALRRSASKRPEKLHAPPGDASPGPEQPSDSGRAASRFSCGRPQSTRDHRALREAVSRVQSIAAVHDLLSDEGRLAGATVEAIARLVVEQASMTFIIRPCACTSTSSRHRCLIAAGDRARPADQRARRQCGRAWFPGPDIAGQIWIRAETKGHMCTLDVENDGEQLPPTFDVAEARGSACESSSGSSRPTSAVSS